MRHNNCKFNDQQYACCDNHIYCEYFNMQGMLSKEFNYSGYSGRSSGKQCNYGRILLWFHIEY